MKLGIGVVVSALVLFSFRLSSERTTKWQKVVYAAWNGGGG